MTITTPRPTEGTADRMRPTVAWTTIQAGLWVGNTAGEFAGMIERSSAGEFFVTDHRARPLGTCATLDDAKARHQRQLQAAQAARKPTI
ncbi:MULTISPECIES: hypothetical protein [unclassified Salinibacterium]|uniref:hypothetical protein n=1 Tax=unclassified Salinibacterium TaxID=2632331 RepID=UPI0018CCFB3C|nr:MULTISPECIES: hypothetical protein [unclassified Salinibacterium]MBH0054982.1 hypothetical protein [Salinibacterium sp. SWN139]MBH0083874.1 hypothetical protein [Salinibacterium sp. SWN167]